MVDPAPRQKLHALQSLRGIAAIIVVLRHASICYPDSNPVTGLVAAILLNSHAAVVVFFVLSGFVLGMSLADEDIDAACMARFYIRRGFRILPVLVFITLATLAYTLSGLSSAAVPGATPMLANNIPHGWPGAKVLLLALISMNSHYAPQNWTVMVELIMALIFPLVFGAARRGWMAPMLAIAAAASFLAPHDGHGLPMVYAVDFCAGIGAYFRWARRPGNAADVSPLVGVMAAAVLIAATPLLDACGCPLVHPANFHDPVTSLIEGAAAAVLVFSLAASQRLAAVLSGRVFLFLGNISFSVYLVHFLLLAVFARLLARFVPAFDDLNMLMRGAVLGAIVLASSIAIAAVLWPWVELPANRFGHRLAGFIKTPRPGGANRARTPAH